MKRRDFLMAASGVAGGTAAGAAVPAAAQDDGDTTTASEDETTTADDGTTEGGESGEGEDSGGGSGGGGGTEEVVVGPGNSLEFDPADLTIEPGTTVLWTWDSDNHNVVAESVPDEADWEGTEGGDDETYDTGYEYEYTFEVEGDYSYYCTPHQQAGMEASITVQAGGGGGAAEVEEDPEHMGVPIQAHFVGIGTLLMIVVSLVYTFFLLKYGESPHSSGSNR